jgi:MoaE-MoaD fusion protein
MKVRLRTFGALAERSGGPEEVLELPDGSTAGDLLDEVGSRYPAVKGLARQIRVAVNLEIAPLSQALADDDEVALLPPVAGGAAIMTGLRENGIVVQEAIDAVTAPEAGGIVVFVGTVRNNAEDFGEVEVLGYSAYQEMAEAVLRQVAEEAAAKWPLAGVSILHSLGDLSVGDHTVVVACSAPHRGEAFEAARYAIDEVKIRVPVWKKESGPQGERWVGLKEPASGPSSTEHAG